MSEQENQTLKVPDIDNTQTKKTIRLRPVLSKSAPTPLVKPAAPAEAVAAEKPAVQSVAPSAPSDTRTRKTVKLKPLMPKIASTDKTVDPLAATLSGTSELDGTNTKTRRAIQLSQARATVKPATIDIGNTPVLTSGTIDDDRTVKVKRSVIAEPANEAVRPALKFNRPAAPTVAAKPAPAVVPPRPAVAPVAAPEVPQVDESDDVVGVEDDETQDKLQLTLSIISAVALLVSATLLILTYFNVQLF